MLASIHVKYIYVREDLRDVSTFQGPEHPPCCSLAPRPQYFEANNVNVTQFGLVDTGITWASLAKLGKSFKLSRCLFRSVALVVTRSEKATDDDVALSPTLIPARGKANDGLSGAGMYSVCVRVCVCDSVFSSSLNSRNVHLQQTDGYFCESGQVLLSIGAVLAPSKNTIKVSMFFINLTSKIDKD